MRKILIAPILTVIICFISAMIIIYFGIANLQKTMEDIHNNCKTCSIFQKDCSFTDKELLEQEYGNNPYCRDMGIYEMRFKLFGVGSLGLSFMLIYLGIHNLFPKDNKSQSPSEQGDTPVMVKSVSSPSKSANRRRDTHSQNEINRILGKKIGSFKNKISHSDRDSFSPSDVRKLLNNLKLDLKKELKDSKEDC